MIEAIKKNNYLFIPKFISEKRASLLATDFKRYCDFVEAEGDQQIPTSQSIHDYLPFVRLLVEKVPHASELFGEDLLPTYVYARVYGNGSELKRHRDRPACEVSLTLNLSNGEKWPIYIQRPDGKEVELILKPGDAMMYLGCIADHWRNKFEGKELIQTFLHYVRSYGENSWAFFDIQKKNEKTMELDDIPYTVI